MNNPHHQFHWLFSGEEEAKSDDNVDGDNNNNNNNDRNGDGGVAVVAMQVATDGSDQAVAPAAGAAFDAVGDELILLGKQQQNDPAADVAPAAAAAAHLFVVEEATTTTTTAVSPFAVAAAHAAVQHHDHHLSAAGDNTSGTAASTATTVTRDTITAATATTTMTRDTAPLPVSAVDEAAAGAAAGAIQSERRPPPHTSISRFVVDVMQHDLLLSSPAAAAAAAPSREVARLSSDAITDAVSEDRTHQHHHHDPPSSQLHPLSAPQPQLAPFSRTAGPTPAAASSKLADAFDSSSNNNNNNNRVQPPPATATTTQRPIWGAAAAAAAAAPFAMHHDLFTTTATTRVTDLQQEQQQQQRRQRPDPNVAAAAEIAAAAPPLGVGTQLLFRQPPFQQQLPQQQQQQQQLHVMAAFPSRSAAAIPDHRMSQQNNIMDEHMMQVDDDDDDDEVQVVAPPQQKMLLLPVAEQPDRRMAATENLDAVKVVVEEVDDSLVCLEEIDAVAEQPDRRMAATENLDAVKVVVEEVDDSLVCLEEIDDADEIVWMGDSKQQQQQQPTVATTKSMKQQEQPDARKQVSAANAKSEVAPTLLAPDQAVSDALRNYSKEWLRRRRRRLRRIGKRSSKVINNHNPSFVALLSVNYDVSDDEEEQEPEEVEVQLELEQLPKRIRIDLDAELGLKDAKPTLIIKRENDNTIYQQDLSSSGLGNFRGPGTEEAGQRLRTYEPTPADEGWYEGSFPAHLREDADYLTKMQQWVRKNVEFFSATGKNGIVAGRRAPITPRGRVGLRCVHCSAKSATTPYNGKSTNSGPLSSTLLSDRKTPIPPLPGSIVYPVSISGLSSSSCFQKLQSHLEECLNLPDHSKMQLLGLLQDSADSAMQQQQRTPRRSEGGMSAAMYFLISARRIGVVDVKDGIRFGRDLELEPLPFATVRSQVESENTGLLMDGEGDVTSAEPRITADAESEAVLAEAVAESDDQPGSMALSRVEDKSLVTDYLFLVIRQMAICNACHMDFSSRGKKTKMLRLGFAGFCCRWCNGGNGQPNWTSTDYSCRSFASASGCLSSSISNLFNTHLQKCYKVPVRIKKALAAYKKIHQRQMAQLPYGSQMRLYRELWSRLRAADKSEEEMKKDMPEIALASYDLESLSTPKRKSYAEDDPVMKEDVVMQPASDDETYRRLPSFPVCDDAETIAILRDAETDWDPVINDHLILPSDRHLISDYVFLAMRQLKIVFAHDVDAQRSRRLPGTSGLPGLACLHCKDQEQGNVSPAGWSFPTAADNFASALNTSLYNHFQACTHLPEHVKRALANTRRVHSAQCSSVKFGSQRRFFNLLFDRIKRVNGSPECEVLSVARNGNSTSFESFLARHGFMEVPCIDKSMAMVICKQCRMVPLQFRARHSTFVGKPRSDLVRQHSSKCKKSCLDLEIIADAMDDILRSDYEGDLGLLDRDTFKTLIRTAVRDETLVKVFTDDVRKLLLQRRAREVQSELGDADSSQMRDLWNAFPSSVIFSNIAEAFYAFAEDIGGMALDLRDHPLLVQYLLLISPSLVVPDKDPDAT